MMCLLQDRLRLSLKLALPLALPLALQLAFVLLAGSRFAHADAVSSCTPDVLDIRVLPPIERATANELHLLIIEIQNRGPVTCQLPGLSVRLLPEGGADPFTNSFWSGEELTAAEKQFEESHGWLAAGDAAHVVVAWNSRDTALMPGCLNRDRVSFSLGINEDSILMVEHLWMHVCGHAYVSRYRPGHYLGEPLPTAWLKLLGVRAEDFGPALVWTQQSVKPAVAVETRSKREMLHDYVELFLELPPREKDCPFVVARKREVNGLTIASINHCESKSAEGAAERTRWTSRMNLPAMGLQPQSTGTIEYEVISSVLENGKPVYAAAKTSLLVRDPELPRLPVIDSPAAECQGAQLQATALPKLDGGKWHVALVYNVMNISSQICRVGGVPKLEFSHPLDRSYSAIPTPCPNCDDPLFQPRPSGWIDLKPQESAHFIVGASRFPQDSGPWRQICDIVESLTLELPSGDPATPAAVTLPFGVGACAQINISAWRAGRYDDDPQNVAYDKTTAEAPQKDLPKQCAGKDFSQLGRPVMVSDGGVAFGLSVAQTKVAAGKPVMLHIWVNNEEDREASVMTCRTLGSFWAGGFEVYDAYGHRLLRKVEVTRLRDSGRMGIDTAVRVEVCGRNFPIPIPAKTCTNGSAFNLPYDFQQNLAEVYDLPQGTYYVVASGKQNAAKIDPAALRGKLRIEIEPN